jgi:DNA-directed RNA polymerase subunit RPC12/RpoP
VSDVTNVIGRSGQGWKFSIGCLAVAGVALLVLVASGPLDGADAAALAAVAAVAASVVVALVLTLVVRCPDCGVRWIWFAVSRQDSHAWIGWLRTLQACPGCGFRGLADPRDENVAPLPKRPLFSGWRNLTRDEILAMIFLFPAIVVAVVVLDGGPWTPVFWVSCAIVALCLACARQPVLLPAAAAYYCIGVFALSAIFTWRIDALIATAVCAAIIALAQWWTERPKRLAAAAFGAGRRCQGCSQPLVPRRITRPDMGDGPSVDHWLHRCECGELTLFGPDGSARQVYDLRRPPERGAGAF